jgi:hypothetical protein
VPIIPVPVAGERESLLEYLRYHHPVLVAVEPELLVDDPWSLVGMMSHRRNEQHVMRADENLTELLASLARHAGHADLIRESIDGATMFPPRPPAAGGS